MASNDDVISLLQNHQIFQALKPSEIPSKQCQNRLAISTSGELFVLGFDNSITFTSLSSLKLNLKSSMTVLQCPRLPESSCSIELSKACRYLSVSSKWRCEVLKFPDKSLSVLSYDQASQCLMEHRASFLDITQTAWHPLSDRHLVVLKHNILRIYNIATEPEKPEQEFFLGSTDRFVGFCFGPNEGWGKFTIYLVNQKGDISVLCPVVPYECVVQLTEIEQLKAGLQYEIESKDDSDDLYAQRQITSRWLEDSWVEHSQSSSLLIHANSNLHDDTPATRCQAHFQIEPHTSEPIHQGTGQPALATSISGLRRGGGKTFTILFRAWNSGVLDVLISSANTSPYWFTGSALHFEDRGNDGASATLLHRKTISDGEILVSIFDQARATPVYCQHTEGVSCIHMDWVDELLRSVELGGENEQQFAKEMNCERIDIWESANHSAGFVNINDSLIGRFSVILDSALECHVFNMDDYSFQFSGVHPKQGPNQPYDIEPFSKLIANFDKRCNVLDKVPAIPPELGKIKVSDLKDPKHAEWLSKVFRAYQDRHADLTQLQVLTKQRLKHLKRITKSQIEVEERCRANLDALSHNSDVYGKKLDMTQELNAQLSSYGTYIIEEIVSTRNVLSNAEDHFRKSLIQQGDDLAQKSDKLVELDRDIERDLDEADVMDRHSDLYPSVYSGLRRPQTDQVLERHIKDDLNVTDLMASDLKRLKRRVKTLRSNSRKLANAN